MDRPTREQVDAVLQRFDAQQYDGESIELLCAEVRALREENETLREGLDEALKPQSMSDEALRDWVDALKSRSDHPEVIAIQRGLLDIIDRAARQLPEVRALVKAARVVVGNDEAEFYKRDDIDALAEALKPFEDKSHERA